MTTPVTIKVYRGDDLVRTERFSREIIKIGRLSSAHLCLEDDRISRIHSVIEVSSDGKMSIIDMGSTEGTFVNGRRISKGPLRHGDEVKLGGLRIVLDGQEAAASTGADQAAGSAPAARLLPDEDRASPKVARDEAPVGLAATAGGAAVAVAVAAPAPAPVAPEPVAAPARRHRPALALANSVDDEPAEEGAPDLGVEMRVLWGDTLLDAGTFVAPAQPVLVGDGPRCHFRLSGPDLPSDAFPMLRYEGGDYRFLFVGGMAGGVIEGGSMRPFAELVKSRAASHDDLVDGAYAVAVPRSGAVRAELGSGLAVEARFKRPPKPAIVPWWEKLATGT